MYSTEELLRDHAFFVRPEEVSSSGPAANGANGSVPAARVAELESEVQYLREQLAKAKGINDTMWETIVQRAVAEGTMKDANNINVVDEMEVSRT